MGKFVDCLKIASADIDYYPLVEVIKKIKKPLIISTGMSDIKRIKKSYDNFYHVNPNKLGIMHCVSAYPAEASELNLNCIKTLKKKFNATIGYSDHSLGIDACLSAVSLGARIIEKHFTLDKNFSDFRDHKLSSDPSELKILVKKIRIIENMLGTSKKNIVKSEKEIFIQTRRYMVAKKNIKKGSQLNIDNVCWVRGEKGVAPVENIYSKKIKLKKNIKKFEKINKHNID